MAKYSPPSIWTDEFNKPKIDGLRDLLDSELQKVFNKVKAKIMELGDVEEDVMWFGECWFWSVAFKIEGNDEPLAILIPSAEDFQIASPLQGDFLEQLSTRRLKRFVRDGIELAMPPHETNWAIWSVSTIPAIDDVMPVLKSKYKFYEAPCED